MNFQIVELTVKDEPFLWEMLYEAIYVPPGELRPPREILKQPAIAHYVQGWGRETDLGFIALDPQTGEKLGAAWLRLLRGADRGYGYVDDRTPELTIAVRETARGRGIGQALLKRLIAAARQPFPGLALSVQAANPARRLYERMGFETVMQAEDTLTMVLRF